MSLFVLDASVAAKWFVPREHEPLAEEAFQFFQRFKQREIRFITPDFFWAEFGNILWKAARFGRVPAESASRAIVNLSSWGIGTRSCEDLVQLAFSIASTYQRTVYDSLYVALALRSRSELITADERLVNALGARFPVRWLGAYR